MNCMPAQDPIFFGAAAPPNTDPQAPQKSEANSEEIHKVNEEVYRQNFELALRNKTLSILRTLYSVSMSSLNVDEVSQKIINVITKELFIPEAIIHVVDNQNKLLRINAVSDSEQIIQFQQVNSVTFVGLTTPLEDNESIISQVYASKEKKVTQDASQIFRPAIAPDLSRKLQTDLNITTFIVYPLLFNNQVLGTLTLGFSKETNELSRSEKETIEELLNLMSISLDRARLYEDLQTANEQLQELDKLKDEFVSLASHELRTPMAAIRGSLSTILEGYAGGISNEAREFLSAAYNENDRLIRLVNNLLNTSRIESGRLNFTVNRLDLSALISDVVHNLQMGAKEKNLYLTFEPAGLLPHVNADEDKIKEVLINLIGNALKFTSTGGIRITAKMDGDFVIACVEDTGTGIHEEDFDLLFKKFSQVKQKFVKSLGGTGLGLYISKKIIEGLGGKIWLTSEVGKGTKFYFSLPIAK